MTQNRVPADSAVMACLATAQKNDLRELLADNIGAPLTPELATSIELSVSRRKAAHADRLDRLQSVLEGMPQADCELTHHFLPGIYVRTITLKKGRVAMGVEHKTKNLIIVSKGLLAVATENGPVMARAGDTFTCLPGTRNAVTALEDSVWTNIHSNPDDEHDLAVLTERYTHSTIEELGGGSRNVQLLRSGAATKELEV